jgi:hypothetical protein
LRTRTTNSNPDGRPLSDAEYLLSINQLLNASLLIDRLESQPTRNRRIPHRFLEPIHNVKDESQMLSTG